MKATIFLASILIAITSVAQVPSYVPTTGLVGWWPFNGNANDESGNGNNGTVNGAITGIDRFLLPTAYYFNGSANIFIPNVFDYPQRTVNIWFFPSIEGPSVMLGSFIFESRDPNLINGRSSIKFSNTEVCMGYNGGINGCAGVVLNTWNMATIVRDIDSTRHYINGDFISSSILGFGTSGSSSGTSLGASVSGFSHFTGSLDDLGIWNRSLTSCEIQDLYNSSLGSANSYSNQIESALDSYTWPFNNQTYSQSGTYTDTIPNAAGCDSIVTLNLTMNFTGINELNQSKLVVSPNPTKDNFSISGLDKLGNVTSMVLKDLNGKTVKVLDPKATQFKISELKPGVYFLTITAENKQEVIKLIKE